MPTSLEAPAPTLPFRFGSPAEYSALRAMLKRHGYHEPLVNDRLEAHERDGARTDVAARGAQDGLDILLQLFHGDALARDAVLAHLADHELALLESLSLVAEDEDDPGLVRGTVLLYPIASLHIVSDVNHDAEQGVAPPADVVYPAITSNTLEFLELLPSDPCERLLELCAGTGIAALAGARHAGHAWAVDITERSTWFARFNAELNGIRNVTVMCGDLYAPVRGERFDRIVAHPPHVPSPTREYIFRDGGADGEQITRRIVAELPEHLAPGGRLYCACMLTDRRDGRVEQRVRAMLGDHADEFDVAVLQRWVMHPSEYHARAAFAGRLAPDEARTRTVALDAMGVERLVYGMLVLQRRATSRAVFTARHQLALDASANTVDWVLRWRTVTADAAFERELLDARPLLTPGVEAHLVQRARDGHWRTDACSVTMREPFITSLDCPLWVPELLGRCDGQVTVRDHHRLLTRDERREPAEHELLGLVHRLLDAGILQLASCPLPIGDGTASG